MKTCPNCEHENPSSANHCMVCGALLVDEEQIPEEVRLKRELAGANETIELLKKSLATLQEKLESSGFDFDTQQLRDQLETSNGTIESLTGRIDSQNSEISNLKNQLSNARKKKGGKWGFIFIVLFVAASIIAYMIWDEKQSLARRDSEQIRELNNRIASLKREKDDGISELDDLKSSYNSLVTEFDELKSCYPLVISDIQIANVDSDGDIETDFGDYLYSGRTMYLKPQISYKGYAAVARTLKTKWIKPDGSLSVGASSPIGFSQSAEYSIYEGNQVLVLSGWGGADMGHWEAGSYRIEVWCGDVMLKSKTFTIY